MTAPVPMIRSQRVRDFLAWSDTLAPGELMRTFRTSPFADLTSAEIDQAHRWRQAEADASIANVERMAAKVADAIVTNALNPNSDRAVPGAGPQREGS